MSIFGKLDAANIPTNPFFVEKGDYPAEVSDAKYQTNRDEVRQLKIEYTITDDTSEYDGKKVSHFFNLVDPEMTTEMFELLPADEKKKLRMNMANLKRTLCGNDGNDNHKGLGVSPDDLNEEGWNPQVVIGTKVTIGISNYGANNEGVNIKWVNLRKE